ncbi:helix-turn-helix transcriptional regulator [Actinoplanes hulinensis]|uniref:Helix-turn-helix transcriptional regulator n=1 Tax=Actinoplanes hulinensis TaxID=1144547 RepID=A0ABS7BH39_9ACTN|nr:helix-turn-helix transcriptional regulator [Actinoplanes hulinensis]MBW6440122.1 helix-turn-helix transcriptional regulator [Actinoplanes hulinensis]
MRLLASRDYESILDLAGRLVGDLPARRSWELVCETLMAALSAPRAAVFDDEAQARSVFGGLKQLAIPVGGPAVVVARGGSDFSGRERAYAARLRPVLVALHHRQPAPGRPDHAAAAGVTPRELAVLRLLAQGWTAVAIGRRLAIHPCTVSKHQQNLYRKLGTNDRLTTVLHAQMLGLLDR